MIGKSKKLIIKQRSIVYIDFNPSRGSEIKKRRPALVMSRDEYSALSNLIIVCPITSSKQEYPYLIPIKHEELSEESKVNVHQVYTMDYTEQGKRNVKILGELEEVQFVEVAQTFLLNFNFNF